MPRSYLCTWGSFGGRRTGVGRRRRRGGRGKLGNGVSAREKGHQGLASGGGDALEVEVALASGAGVGGGRGSSPELKRRQQLTGRAEQAGGGRQDPVANTEKPGAPL
jgi:hypothetical protein